MVARQPWLVSRQAIKINPFDDYTQWKRAIGEAPDSEPGKFQTTAGFEVRLIRAAAPNEGSWISMTFDPQGRVVIAREDKGLLRMTLDKDGDRVARVETINDELLECRGLLFAHESLYANANNSKGLYRLRDVDAGESVVVRAEGNWRVGKILVIVSCAGENICRVGEIVKRSQGGAGSSPDGTFQHPSDPTRDPRGFAVVVDDHRIG